VLRQFLMGQYAHPSVGAVDLSLLAEAGANGELLAGLLPGDLHWILLSGDEGEVLGYALLMGLGEALPGTTLRRWERPLFPVERIHGWGIYGRLHVLPETPVEQVCELCHFSVRQTLSPLDERRARAPVELGLAVARGMGGPLRGEVAAVIGDDPVARDVLEFLHVPLVAIRGTVPDLSQNRLFSPRYEQAPVIPWAFLAADLGRATLARLDMLEGALASPGKHTLLDLVRLRMGLSTIRSSLAPPESLGGLADAVLPASPAPPALRRQVLDLAERLRTIDLFAALSDAEARILASHLEPRTVEAGRTIVRQGDSGDEFFLIESGQAEVSVTGRSGEPSRLGTLGAGDHFGEIALVTGGRRTADVAALTPMTLLVLGRAAYQQYLTRLVEIEQEINRTAAARAGDTIRHVLMGEG